MVWGNMINFYSFHTGVLDKEEIYKHPISVFDRSCFHVIYTEIEHIIKKEPRWAYYYSLRAKGGRWPEAEPYIMKDSGCTIDYAKDVIKGRWVEAEPVIMKRAAYAYSYARYVLKSRWYEAEPDIMKNEMWWRSYKSVFKL